MRCRVASLCWLVLLSLGACSVVAGRSGHQCDSDLECRGLGEAFASTRCSVDRVCVEISVPVADAGDLDGATCSTNAECSALLGVPARCIQATCQTLRSEDCASVPGDAYLSENAVYIGVMGPLRGQNLNYGANYINAAWTATSALNASTATLARSRPIVVVGCDEATDPVRAATFLIESVKVRAIIGPLFDDAVEAVLPVTKRANIPLLSPLSDNPKYTAIPNTDGLTWSCSPNRADALTGWARAVVRVGDVSNAATSRTTTRVLLGSSREPSVQAFADRLVPLLNFNGKSAPLNAATDDYTRVDYDYNPNEPASVASLAGTAFQKKPSVILIPSLFGAAEAIDAVEAGWPDGPRPYYIVHRLDPAVARGARASDAVGRRKRIFALDWDRSDQIQTNAAQYAGAYSQRTSTSAAWLSETAYDCTFAYAYAGYAAVGRQNGNFDTLSGAQFAAGMTVLGGPGQPFQVGTDQSRATVETLVTTTLPIELTGASSDFKFDSALGAPHANSALYCVNSSGDWYNTGIVYDRSADSEAGVFDCP